jgi:hypothetical protein
MGEVFLKWDPAQVSGFVRSVLPEEEEHLATNFLDHNIEGNLLPLLTTENLQELGIETLRSRLIIKRAISDLIVEHYLKFPQSSFNDSQYNLANCTVNDNYVSVEALSLSSVLISDMLTKISQIKLSAGSEGNDSKEEIKRLQESVAKLKAEMTPISRIIKKSKPLPTPTLDPGLSSTALDSPTFSMRSDTSDSGQENHNPLSRSPSGKDDYTLFQLFLSSQIPSPTFSKRFSSGTLLSLGTGKVIQQSITEQPRGDSKHVGTPDSVADEKPRLIENKSQTNKINVFNDEHHNAKPLLKQTRSTNSVSKSHNLYNQAAPLNEPLKQLRASSEDSCLKILQLAMKRYHIPRDDWSKYVLVVCYGDKERILKLAEKPVSIVKELNELGKHPTIMLRQLADTTTQEGKRYEDSRIAKEIPGGTL